MSLSQLVKIHRPLPLWGLPLVMAVGVFAWAQGPEANPLSIMRQSNGEAALTVTVPAGQFVKFEISPDMAAWEPLHTGQSNGTVSYTDTGSPYRTRRFYRAVPVSGTNVVTGDHVQTSDGVVTVKPIYHGSFYLHWAGSGGTKIIYSDPSSQGAPAGRFTGLPKADLVVLTHRHGDHLNVTTLDGLRNGTGTSIVAPQDVFDGMGTTTAGTTLKSLTTIFKTGQTSPASNSPALQRQGVTIEGVPAYNANHVKGNCNSYILTIGGKRFYISGDTGTTPEMNAMPGIDVAFLCINVPFTLTVADAAAATRAFRPRMIYPYHFRNQDGSFSDLGLFKTTVGQDLGIEVRNRNWY